MSQVEQSDQRIADLRNITNRIRDDKIEEGLEKFKI